MMVTAVSEIISRNQTTRPPLLPSEKDNDVIIVPKNSITPKSKQVSSRYLSQSPSASSRRSPSPLITRNSVAKRSVSAERRRPTRPDVTIKPNNVGELSAATKLLVTSTRSLSVSFQGESFSLPISKTKKPMDQHRWPARIRQPNVTVLSKTSSFDCGVDKNKINSSGYLDLSNSIDLINPNQQNPDGNSVKDSYSDTDTDSVSSGSNSGIQENELNRSRNGSLGLTVSTKFWQETNSRMRRLQDSNGSKLITPQKHLNSKRFLSDNPLSSPRTMTSPVRMRPSSPSKFMTSSSPSPSVLSFAVDVRRGKVGENRFFDAHLLRLLYNRQLQWRFVNARSEDIILKQKHSVEENLWNAWITISDVRDSVTKKRHRLQLLRQKLKLASVLKAQIVSLEDWEGYLDRNHSISLLGAIEALKATTLRLPVGVGATGDLQSMKDAISSAHDVMQAMGSSTHSLCLQVEQVNLMVTELAKMSSKERVLLRICKDFLSVLSALKVKDCSLRTHKLQQRN